MRKHPEIGHQILQTIGFLTQAAEIVPRTRSAGRRRISPPAQGDGDPARRAHLRHRHTLDAMTSDRPYRRGVSYEDARAEIARCSATQFDPACVDAFVSLTVQELTQLRDRRGM